MDPLGAFETFLIWATGLLALAAVVVPFRYVWPCVASFAMFVAMFFEWPFEHDTRGSSPFSGTGEAIATLVFMLMAAPIALKLMACFVVLWRRRAQAGQARMPSPAHSVAGGERLLMGIAITGTGAVAGVLLVSTFAEHMAGQYPSLVVHMAGIAFVLALWALTPWCSRRLRLEGRFARLAAGLRWSVVATSLVAAAFIAFSIDRAWSIEQRLRRATHPTACGLRHLQDSTVPPRRFLIYPRSRCERNVITSRANRLTPTWPWRMLRGRQCSAGHIANRTSIAIRRLSGSIPPAACVLISHARCRCSEGVK
jgi:hypothetical protein